MKTQTIPSAAMHGAKLGFAVLLALSMSCASSGRNGRPPADMSMEERTRVESEARAFAAHYVEVLESGDEDLIRTLYVKDDRFAWYTDGALAYSSIDDVLAAKRRYAGTKFETTFSEVTVVPLGTNLASVQSVFNTELTIPGRDNYVFGGVITQLLEMSIETGEWAVLLGHTSTPGGPPGK